MQAVGLRKRPWPLIALGHVALCIALHGRGSALEFLPLGFVAFLLPLLGRPSSTLELELILGTLVALRVAPPAAWLVELMLLGAWAALGAYELLRAVARPSSSSAVTTWLYCTRLPLLALTLFWLQRPSPLATLDAYALPVLKGVVFLLLGLVDPQPPGGAFARYGALLVTPSPIVALILALALAVAVAVARGAVDALLQLEGEDDSPAAATLPSPPLPPPSSLPAAAAANNNAALASALSIVGHAHTNNNNNNNNPIDQLDVNEAFRLAMAQYHRAE
jgi:hypothetical protein